MRSAERDTRGEEPMALSIAKVANYLAQVDKARASPM
jgi:hypothetical protein